MRISLSLLVIIRNEPFRVDMEINLEQNDKSFHCYVISAKASHAFLSLAQQPPLGQDFFIHEVSRSHTTHHSR
jgi:hypothetical protein